MGGLSIPQICWLTNVIVKWVNSDRQFADILTKQGVASDNLDRALRTNQWKVVFDASVTCATDL
eukprot:4890193-Lingulodinium_polyedra.AAC.1